jgi:hypothetical protein
MPVIGEHQRTMPRDRLNSYRDLPQRARH